MYYTTNVDKTLRSHFAGGEGGLTFCWVRGGRNPQQLAYERRVAVEKRINQKTKKLILKARKIFEVAKVFCRNVGGRRNFGGRRSGKNLAKELQVSM